MPVAQAVKKDTKEAIMDAAETVMAEHGVDGASIRAIVGRAGANTAAIHYHFRSREGLIDAILGRHGRSTSLRRVELIDEFDRTGRTPTPMDLVNILVDPLIELLEEEGEAGRRFLRFLARLQSDRKHSSRGSALHVKRERERHPKIRKRMIEMVKQACPDVPDTDLDERLTMMVDLMLQSLARAEFMSSEWEADEQTGELYRYTANLKAFLGAGLAAPVAKYLDQP